MRELVDDMSCESTEEDDVGRDESEIERLTERSKELVPETR